MWAKSTTGRTQCTRRLISTQSSSEPKSLTRPMTSIPNGHGAALPLQPLAHERQLLDDGVDRRLTAPAEEEAGVEDDHLRAAGCGDPGAAVERPERGRPLAPARLEVPDPAEERCVHREREVVLAGELAESLGPRVVHPEPGLEVDLAGVVAPLEEQLDGRLGALAVGDRAPARPGFVPSSDCSRSAAGTWLQPTSLADLRYERAAGQRPRPGESACKRRTPSDWSRTLATCSSQPASTYSSSTSISA